MPGSGRGPRIVGCVRRLERQGPGFFPFVCVKPLNLCECIRAGSSCKCCCSVARGRKSWVLLPTSLQDQNKPLTKRSKDYTILFPSQSL